MGKKINTSIIHSGSDPKIHFGSINDPVYKNSTLVFDDYNSFSLKADYFKQNIKKRSKNILEKIRKLKKQK